MAEMNIPGIETARMKVAQLSKNPINNGRTKLPDRIVRELYTEIRSARIAGASWNYIAKAISEATSIKFTGWALNTAFAMVDLEYEKKTGEPALPTSTHNKVRFKKRS